MAEKYWYGTNSEPIDRALKNLKEFTRATTGGSAFTDETVSVEFPTALERDRHDELNQNMIAAGYKFRRQETV